MAYIYSDINNINDSLEDIDKNSNNVYLSDSELLNIDIEEKKAYLQEAFDYSKYKMETITLIDESAFKEDIDVQQKNNYLYFRNNTGKQLYLNIADQDIIFAGKYTLYKDMYDFMGYDEKDKFIIYYSNKIPDNGNLAESGLVTIIPEYQLIGSKALGEEMGTEAIADMTIEFTNYLYNYDSIEYRCMSIEEAVLKSLENHDLKKNDFYRKELENGGFYYTNGEIDIIGTASYCAHNINSAPLNRPKVFVKYEIKGYNKSCQDKGSYLFYDIFYNNSN